MWQDRLLVFRQKFTHPAWGVEHSERVYAVARQLAEGDRGSREGGPPESLDWEAVFAAAHLHDLGALPPYREAGVDHAERSARIAPEILTEVGFPRDRVPLVQQIIRGHMFYAEPGPAPEALLFRDADTLDFLGAIGVARVLSIVGLDDWTPNLKAAVELLDRFSRELPGELRLSKAREVGERRRLEMEAYLAALAAETGELSRL